MTKQTTTKASGGWNPPRLNKLALGNTDSGTKGGPGGVTYEGSQGGPSAPPAFNQPSAGYRMPTSVEPIPWPYPWQ